MALVDRAKNIILSPKTEWDVIAAETTPPGALITGYVLPLAAISAVASFIGTSLIGFGMFRMSIGWGLGMLVYQLIMAVVSVFVVSLIIDALAPTFGGTKNRNQALKVAAYSYTPAWVAGILMILPMLGILVFLAALYGIYLLYLGLPRLMRNPPEKSAGYTALVVVCAIVIGVVISMIAGAIGGGAMMGMGRMGSVGGSGSAVVIDKDSSLGKLDEFSKKMEEASKRMEAAQKSGDASKQAEAATAMLGTALSGGKGVEPVQIDQLKPMLPASFAGLPKTNDAAERGGVPGLMATKVNATYGDPGAGKNVHLEISDTGGAAGLMTMAAWMNVQSERQEGGRTERTRKEGNRLVHEETDKDANQSKYTVVVGERYVVEAEGNNVDLNTLKTAVASLDLGKLESLK